MTDMSEKSETSAAGGETAKPRTRRAPAKPAGEGQTASAAAKSAPKPSSRNASEKTATKPKATTPAVPKSDADKGGSSGKWIGIGSAAAAIGSAAVAAAVLYSKRAKPEVTRIAPSTKDEEAGGD